jgi:hypothetical protein
LLRPAVFADDAQFRVESRVGHLHAAVPTLLAHGAVDDQQRGERIAPMFAPLARQGNRLPQELLVE